MHFCFVYTFSAVTHVLRQTSAAPKSADLCVKSKQNKMSKSEKISRKILQRRFIHTSIAFLAIKKPLPKAHTNEENFYTILDLKQTATSSEIKTAYYAQSKEFHPDRNSSEIAKNVYRDVRAAYEVLSDKSKRRDYDYSLKIYGYDRYNTHRPHMKSRRNANEDFIKEGMHLGTKLDISGWL